MKQYGRLKTISNRHLVYKGYLREGFGLGVGFKDLGLWVLGV